MSKFLDTDGLSYLWSKIKSKFSESYNLANSAKTAADNAQSTANAAKSSAATAQNTANSASTTAIDAIKAMSTGTMLNTDPCFATGYNGCHTYNNLGNGNTTIERVAKSQDNPFVNTNYELKITNTGKAGPYCGGFCFKTPSRANARFIYRIIAKAPSGKPIQFVTNNIGSAGGGTWNWLTSRTGTDNFEEYIVQVKCGSSGDFQDTGYFYLDANWGTPSNPIEWRVAYATCIDMTGASDAVIAKETATTANNNANETRKLSLGLIGRTAITQGDTLNQVKYLVPDTYFTHSNSQASTLKDCPVRNAFSMNVYHLTSNKYGRESLDTWQYIYREITTFNGEKWKQMVYSGSQAGMFVYDQWIKICGVKGCEFELGFDSGEDLVLVQHEY